MDYSFLSTLKIFEGISPEELKHLLPCLNWHVKKFKKGDFIFVPDIRKAVEEGRGEIPAFAISDQVKAFTLGLGEMTEDEREIILKGCLINYYRAK